MRQRFGLGLAFWFAFFLHLELAGQDLPATTKTVAGNFTIKKVDFYDKHAVILQNGTIEQSEIEQSKIRIRINVPDVRDPAFLASLRPPKDWKPVEGAIFPAHQATRLYPDAAKTNGFERELRIEKLLEMVIGSEVTVLRRPQTQTSMTKANSSVDAIVNHEATEPVLEEVKGVLIGFKGDQASYSLQVDRNNDILSIDSKEIVEIAFAKVNTEIKKLQGLLRRRADLSYQFIEREKTQDDVELQYSQPVAQGHEPTIHLVTTMPKSEIEKKKATTKSFIQIWNDTFYDWSNAEVVVHRGLCKFKSSNVSLAFGEKGSFLAEGDLLSTEMELRQEVVSNASSNSLNVVNVAIVKVLDRCTAKSSKPLPTAFCTIQDSTGRILVEPTKIETTNSDNPERIVAITDKPTEVTVTETAKDLGAIELKGDLLEYLVGTESMYTFKDIKEKTEISIVDGTKSKLKQVSINDSTETKSTLPLIYLDLKLGTRKFINATSKDATVAIMIFDPNSKSKKLNVFKESTEKLSEIAKKTHEKAVVFGKLESIIKLKKNVDEIEKKIAALNLQKQELIKEARLGSASSFRHSIAHDKANAIQRKNAEIREMQDELAKAEYDLPDQIRKISSAGTN